MPKCALIGSRIGSFFVLGYGWSTACNRFWSRCSQYSIYVPDQTDCWNLCETLRMELWEWVTAAGNWKYVYVVNNRWHLNGFRFRTDGRWKLQAVESRWAEVVVLTWEAVRRVIETDARKGLFLPNSDWQLIWLPSRNKDSLSFTKNVPKGGTRP